MPKISVIIPVYNTEQFLKECLDSVANQTLKDIEIICVDDGSTDKSLEILNEYSKNDKRIKILKQKNQYAGVARNNGLKNAQGEYIYFLDSDDYIDNKCLEYMYNKIKISDSDICLIKCNEYNQLTKERYKLKQSLDTKFLKRKNIFSIHDIEDNIFQLAYVSLSLKLYKKAFLDKLKVEFQNTKTTNDVYFNYVCLLMAKKITYLNKYLMTYRRNRPKCLTLQRGKSFDVVMQEYNKIKNFIITNGFNNVEESFYRRAYNAFSAESDISNGNLTIESVKNFFPNNYWILLNDDNYKLKHKFFNITILEWIFSVKNFNNKKLVIFFGKKYLLNKKQNI